MKYYFKFKDGSIAYLENKKYQWYNKPVQIYVNDNNMGLGFGKWEDYI
jgi:hypothetical protein